nr:glycosyltransferase family 4 protein [Rhizobium halophilum]
MPDSGADSLSTRLVRTLERASAVLSNSNFTAQIASRICPDVKPQIVGCGIPVKLLDLLESRSPSYSGDVRARRRARLGLGSATTVTYVGRLVRHKNLFQLIELGAMTGFQIVLIGGGPLRTQLQARAIEAGANVHFEEEASDERKWQVLEASDFGYMMSDYDSVSGGFEGFGIAMLEYSAAGAVCLSSGGHGMADFAHHGFTTFDPRGADGELSGEVLKNLAADEPSMNQLVSASRALLRQEYTWSRVAEKLLEAL